MDNVLSGGILDSVEKGIKDIGGEADEQIQSVEDEAGEADEQVQSVVDEASDAAESVEKEVGLSDELVPAGKLVARGIENAAKKVLLEPDPLSDILGDNPFQKMEGDLIREFLSPKLPKILKELDLQGLADWASKMGQRGTRAFDFRSRLRTEIESALKKEAPEFVQEFEKGVSKVAEEAGEECTEEVAKCTSTLYETMVDGVIDLAGGALEALAV